MARLTRAEKQAQTRSLLIEAASKLFAEYGYAFVSVDSISEAAGFSRGAFYSNFDTKEEIARAVLESYVLVEDDSLIHAVAAARGNRKKIVDQIIRTIANREQDALVSALRIELFLQAGRNADLRAVIVAAYEKRFQLYEPIYARLLAQSGASVSSRPKKIFDAVSSVLLGHSLLLRAGVDAAPLADIFSYVLNNLATGKRRAASARVGIALKPFQESPK